MADPYTPLGFTLPRIDWANPRLPRQPYQGSVGQSVGSLYSPIADALASWGVQQGGPAGGLASAAAPGMNQIERFMGGVRGAAAEATGLPAAGRAGEALAEGQPMQAAGQALQALPSRLTQIPGILISDAAAQPQDPRIKRIQDLNADIAKREKLLEGYATKNFQSKKAREDASAPHLQAIGAARTEATRLQEAMDAEYQAAEAERRAAERGAAWRNTSTNRAHPGAGYGTTALGFGLASYLPYRAARTPTLAYNRTVADLDARWRAAIDRANDMSLTLPQRRQAATEAIGLRTQFRSTNAPEGPTWGDRGRTAIISGLTADAGIMAPDLFDYIYSMQDPEGALHSSSASQLNPLNNPGRVTAGFLGGAGLGGVGEELGTRFPRAQTPTGYDAETDALLKRFKSLAPRGRRRR